MLLKKTFEASCALLLTFFIAGCDWVGLSLNRDVAVIDLDVIAKATGQDEIISEQLDTAASTLNAQLNSIAGQLDSSLKQQVENLPHNNDKAIKQLNIDAAQKLQQNQRLAQQKAVQYREGLIRQYREEIAGVVHEIARDQGFSLVLTSNATLLWFDDSIDITDEVIARLRANSYHAGQGLKEPMHEADIGNGSVSAELLDRGVNSP